MKNKNKLYMLNKSKIILNIMLIVLFVSCSNTNSITISKLENSPSYENSNLSLNDIKNEDDKHIFSFKVNDYELGAQTQNNFNFQIANSGKGQHIHLIINNNPYSAHYENIFEKELVESNNVILAFLSRSYHESVKNKNAYILTQIGDNGIDLNNEFLFYSRPKGVYKNGDTEKILLDFYLVNTKLSPDGNRVRATINDVVFYIYEWSPYFIEGLPKGENKIKLELLNNKNQLIKTSFNPSIRTIVLE